MHTCIFRLGKLSAVTILTPTETVLVSAGKVSCPRAVLDSTAKGKNLQSPYSEVQGS